MRFTVESKAKRVKAIEETIERGRAAELKARERAEALAAELKADEAELEWIRNAPVTNAAAVDPSAEPDKTEDETPEIIREPASTAHRRSR